MADVKTTKDNAEITWGTKYKSQTGSDIEYSAGTKSSISASADSRVSMGASWNFDIASAGGSVTFYDSKFSTQYHGASSGIEIAHQKSYQDTFSIAVGSIDPLLLKRTQILSALILIPQIGTLIAIPWAPAKISGLFKDEKAQQKVTEIQGIVQMSIMASNALIAAAGAVWLHCYKRAKLVNVVDKSKATVAVSKNARAFLGVQDSDRASGIQFAKDSFKLLAFGGPGGTFSRVGLGVGNNSRFARHGWEVVGFTDPNKAKTEISGDNDSLKMRSPLVSISAAAKKSDSKITVGPIDNGSHGVKIESSGKNSRIILSSDKEISLNGGKSASKGRLVLQEKIAKLQTGPAHLFLADDKFRLGGYAKNQQIEITPNNITIGHGDNAMKLSSVGLDLCNGAIKILNGAVVIPDIQQKIDAQKKHLQEEIESQIELTEMTLSDNIKTAVSKVEDTVDKIKSEVDSRLR